MMVMQDDAMNDSTKGSVEAGSKLSCYTNCHISLNLLKRSTSCPEDPPVVASKAAPTISSKMAVSKEE